jgi:hypothetical protein
MRHHFRHPQAMFNKGSLFYKGVRSVGPVRRAHRFCSGLRGRWRTYHTILKLADHVLFKMVMYVLLRSLRPEQN